MPVEPKIVIIQPTGPQGQQVGIRIDNAEQFQRFDNEVGQLPANKRQTREGLLKAAKQTEVTVVEDN